MNELTIREVAQHYGQRCVYERLPRYKYTSPTEWQPGKGTVNPSLLRDLERGQIRNIRPILKPIDSMTEEDAIEIIRRYGGEEDLPTQENREKYNHTALDYLFQKSEWYWHTIKMDMGNYKRREILLELGYDCDNLIGRGLAIDATKEVK